MFQIPYHVGIKPSPFSILILPLSQHLSVILKTSRLPHIQIKKTVFRSFSHPSWVPPLPQANNINSINGQLTTASERV